ncbi:hypothetical protein ABGV49_19815 [Chromobacterium vaccinii]|uniref:Uncharacterized protein n=1 Tax=Chromobacterium vaccinii TaxID=1108595 RepID=A0ABV0FGT9_9NEIS|nr:hypothetical protein [Chromobacterium vaccinii]
MFAPDKMVAVDRGKVAFCRHDMTFDFLLVVFAGGIDLEQASLV